MAVVEVTIFYFFFPVFKIFLEENSIEVKKKIKNNSKYFLLMLNQFKPIFFASVAVVSVAAVETYRLAHIQLLITTKFYYLFDLDAHYILDLLASQYL